MELGRYLFVTAPEYQCTLWIREKDMGYTPGCLCCLSRESNLGKFQVATRHLGGFYYIPFYVHLSVSGVDTVYIISYVYTHLLSLEINLASPSQSCFPPIISECSQEPPNHP
jgi:hypothetical protein